MPLRVSPAIMLSIALSWWGSDGMVTKIHTGQCARQGCGKCVRDELLRLPTLLESWHGGLNKKKTPPKGRAPKSQEEFTDLSSRVTSAMFSDEFESSEANTPVKPDVNAFGKCACYDHAKSYD